MEHLSGYNDWSLGPRRSNLLGCMHNRLDSYVFDPSSVILSPPKVLLHLHRKQVVKFTQPQMLEQSPSCLGLKVAELNT